MAQQPSTLVISKAERVRVATVDGEIDMATADHLERALVSALEAADLVVDLSACSFLDSSAIRALVTTMRAARRLDRGLAIVIPEGMARTVLDLTGIFEEVRTYENLDQALRALSDRSRRPRSERSR
jgi:anti-sigma B factor antagonist